MRWFAAVICVALGACEDREARELERARDEVCACYAHLEDLQTKGMPVSLTDRQTAVTCAETSLKQVPAIADPDREPTHRTQRIARDMLDCLAKVYAAQRPETDDATAPGTKGSASAGTP